MQFKKKIAKNLFQLFFAIVNGSRSVDARRMFTQFLIPMSWAKTNILQLWFPFISRHLTGEYIQGKILEDDTINMSVNF
jgi:hypothetical protein